MLLTIDSFAWIELIRGGPAGTKVRQLLASTSHCFVSAVTLPEVALRLKRDGWPDSDVLAELREMLGAADLVPIDAALALDASRCTLELREKARASRIALPGLADALVLATARATGSRVLTGDAHFRGIEGVEWLESTAR